MIGPSEFNFRRPYFYLEEKLIPFNGENLHGYPL